jgi:hypothetical protein
VRTKTNFAGGFCCCQTFLKKINIWLAKLPFVNRVAFTRRAFFAVHLEADLAKDLAEAQLKRDADKRAQTEIEAPRAGPAFDNLKLAAIAVVIAAKADVRLKTQYEKD